MKPARINKNGGTHRILHALTITPCTTTELKSVVGAVNSLKKFHGDYLAKLVAESLIADTNGVWTITEAGRARLAEIGIVTGMSHFKNRKQNPFFFLTERDYTASDIIKAPRRPGSETYLGYASRINNQLVYPRSINGK